MTTEIKGLRGLVRAMKRYDEKVLVALKAINLRAAERVAAKERDLAPKRTGALAASVRPGALKYAAVVRTGSSKVLYANPIVYGWPAHNIEKNPFPYDALDSERAAVAAEYDTSLAALARETFRKDPGE